MIVIPKQQIKQFILQTLDGAEVVSGGTEIAAPCPICGERRKKLYIGPFDDSDRPIKYNCFKCPAQGYVDQYFLDECGISGSIDANILKMNKGSSYKTKSINNSDRIQYNLNWSNISMNELSNMKLQYINQRLGIQLTFQDCIENKIVLNLSDLLQSNNINYLTRHPNAIQQLNTYFIGFLSRSNSSLNMRNLIFKKQEVLDKLHESLRSKYVNYKIFSDTASDDFYVLPCNIDITRTVKVYIAEGAFDILGIKYNLIKSIDNCVYIAGRGKAYENALLWLIKTLAVYNMEVHYFPDKDVPIRDIKLIINKFKPAFGYRFFIHNNTYRNEKDYGVPAWRINDTFWEE